MPTVDAPTLSDAELRDMFGHRTEPGPRTVLWFGARFVFWMALAYFVVVNILM